MLTYDVSNMDGIRLTDDKGETILEKDWCTVEPMRGSFKPRDVPEGEVLIGMMVSKNFRRFGLKFYKPSQ